MSRGHHVQGPIELEHTLGGNELNESFMRPFQTGTTIPLCTLVLIQNGSNMPSV